MYVNAMSFYTIAACPQAPALRVACLASKFDPHSLQHSPCYPKVYPVLLGHILLLSFGLVKGEKIGLLATSFFVGETFHEI